MPKLTDSDAGKVTDQEIVFTQNTTCPSCDTVTDTAFPTGAYDEDGLTDLEELEAEVTCPNAECGEVYTAEFTGWTNYGDA